MNYYDDGGPKDPYDADEMIAFENELHYAVHVKWVCCQKNSSSYLKNGHEISIFFLVTKFQGGPKFRNGGQRGWK